MSRREDRNSDTRRHRSRFDREPSPKRSRRDGKPETQRERVHVDTDLDKDHLDRDQKHRHKLNDTAPLEAPSAPDSKLETRNESERKTNGQQHEGAKPSSDPSKVPRSRSYFQHDDRRQVGRSFSRRTDADREWRDQREQRDDRKTVAGEKDEKAKDKREDNQAWRHDKYHESDADPKPLARKRPSFREQKLLPETEKTDKYQPDPVRANPEDRPITSERWGERNVSRHSDRGQRPFSGERGDTRRGNFSSRDRYGAGGSYRGRDRFDPSQGYRSAGGRVEKWKHDLYQDANRSPTPKNEEEQIAKIEALLAS